MPDIVPLLWRSVISGGTVVTYTISGTVTDRDAAGLSGVTLTLTGDASDSTSSAGDGTYSFTVPDGGSYTITPTKAGETFTPTSTVVNISGINQSGKDFQVVFTEVSFDFEGGTIGQPITTGTDWVQGNLSADLPLVQAQPTGLGYKFSGYTNCMRIDPDSNNYVGAVDIGSVLPADFRVEFGCFILDQEYCFAQVQDVNLAWANVTNMVRTNVNGDGTEELINLSYHDGATVDNDASGGQTSQTFDRPTKIRLEYTASSRLLSVVAIKNLGATWSHSTTIDASVVMTGLRWLLYYGGSSSAYWGTTDLVYAWAGKKTDDWPTRAIIGA